MSKKIWAVLKCENRLSFHLAFLIVGLLITSSLFSVNCAASIENNLAISERFINYWIKGQFAEAASLLVEKEGFNAIEELKLNQEKFTAVVGNIINYQIDREASTGNIVYVLLECEKDLAYMTFRFDQTSRIMSINISLDYYLKNRLYSPEYIIENRGKVLIQSPEVFELSNIIIALTDFGLEDRALINKRGEYYRQVIEHFSEYRDHPLISQVNFSRRRLSDYVAFRSNSLAYHFAGDKIVKNETFFKIRNREIFAGKIGLIEDFAKISDFRGFYHQHKEFYQSASETYQATVPLQQMWDWLEEQFPIEYDTYKVIISPLINSTRNTFRLEQAGFKECIMFVPTVNNAAIGSLAEALHSRGVFTEIVHNYVNPTTDQYLSTVDQALHDYQEWNKQLYHYQSAYTTFNEYVTWGTFLLYAYDHYQAEVFLRLKEIVVEQMIFNRSFVHFEHFVDFYLELYKNRGKQKISAFYPEIIAWFASYQVNGAISEE